MGQALCALVGVVAVAGTALAADPPANIAPTPDFDASCVVRGGVVVAGYCTYDPATGAWSVDTPQREAAGLAALGHARASAGLPPLVLPRDWNALTPDQQQFVLTDLVRTGAGLPPLVAMSPALDAVALGGARARADPVASGVWLEFASAANWAGDAEPAVAMYGYLYLDGWGGSPGATPNLDCTGPGAPGCWGHRHAVLGNYGSTGLMGVGTVPGSGVARGSSAQFYSAYDGAPLSVSYTWADALAEGAGGAAPTAPTPSPVWPFRDMSAAPWAAGAAAAMATAGVVQGTGPNTFSPTAEVTLQELVTLLARTLRWPAATGGVPAGTATWAAGAMSAAAQAGLLPAGVLPAQPLTRAQAVRLTVAALRLPAAAAPMPYSDLGGLSAPDLRALTTAVADGLLAGVGDGRLDPWGPLDRAQTVVLLLRAALLRARAGRTSLGSLSLAAAPQPGGGELYAAGSVRMWAAAAGADPTAFSIGSNLLAQSGGAWWTGVLSWIPETPPSWATGALGYGRATADLWPAGQQGDGPALFGPTVRVLTFYPGDTKELLPGAGAWVEAAPGAATDPLLAVLPALG